jgi:hypothetical protein
LPAVSLVLSSRQQQQEAAVGGLALLAAAQTLSSLPAPVNLILYQGDDFVVDITVTNADGSAADLTGYTASSQVRDKPDGTLQATFSCAVDPDVGNLIHLRLPHSEAANLVPGSAAWDAQIAGPMVVTLVAGLVTVIGEVTT